MNLNLILNLDVNFINFSIAVFLIVLLILIFYHAFRLKWPDLYFSVNNMAALFISVSFKRYIAFRFIPVFLITTLVIGVLAKGLESSVALFMGLISGVVYALLTDGRAIFDLVTKSKRIKVYFNYHFQIALHSITILLLIVTGCLAGLFSKTQLVSSITPSPQGLADNIWSALLTVIIITFLEQIYSEKGLSLDEIFERSLKGISASVLNAIDKYSVEYNANLTLIKAVCIVENIQRPKWLRKIENIKAFLRMTGTYGIMQITANRLVTDTESVKIATENYFRDTAQVKDNKTLSQLISKYNPSETYIDLVLRAMYFLDPYSTEYPG